VEDKFPRTAEWFGTFGGTLPQEDSSAELDALKDRLS
jgi:hypothetical protein